MRIILYCVFMTNKLMLALTVVVASSCGGAAPSIKGMYIGTATSQGETFAARVDLIGEGADGIFYTAMPGVTGKTAGNLERDQVKNFSATIEGIACPGVYRGVVTANGSVLKGRITTESEDCGLTAIDMDLRRK